MKKLILLPLLFITTLSYAELKGPPILKDVPIATQQYLKDIADNHNVLEITTTAPNGNRLGRRGEIILYNNGSNLTLWTNTTGLKVWQQL